MTQNEPSLWDARLYHTFARLLFLGAALYVALRFLDAILFILLLFALSFILVIALNPVVVWLEARKVPRAVGTLLLFAAIIAAVGLLGWLAVPRLVTQAVVFVEQLPDFVERFQEQLARLSAAYPAVQDALTPDDTQVVEQLTMWLQDILLRAGQYSLSFVAALALAALVAIIVAFTLARPRPLLEAFMTALPLRLRDPAERAFVRGSEAVSAWLVSDLIIGAIEAVSATIVLSLLNVPGALLWGALAFFSELIPSIGVYIMSVPPIIVGFAIDPLLGLWVALFYIVLAQVTSYFLVPMVRSSAMDMHPVTLLFAALALASVFGLLGAVIAAPLAGMLKAFYEEFYVARQPVDARLEQRVENMLKKGAGPVPAERGKDGEGNEG